MNNKDKVLKIISHLEQIFQLTDETKQDIYNKMSLLTSEKIGKITESLVQYQDKQELEKKKLLSNLEIDKNNIEEIQEKQEFNKRDKDFFNEL